MGLEGVEWIKLAYTGPHGRPLNMVMNLCIQREVENFLTKQLTIRL
jgi:hypothetical protein